MNSQYIIGLDVGTSGCKAILVNQNAKVIKSHVADYPLSIPRPGWSEQNPADWWDRAKLCIREVIKGRNKADIKAIGLSAQMHGLVALDVSGEVIRPAILWNDQRTVKQCEEITERAGGLESLIGLVNNSMLPGYTGGKILWIKENEPENYAKINMMLNPKDYIRYKLTGEYATEVSDASGTGLFNVKDRRWSDKLLSLLEVDRKKLPPVFESTEQTGKVDRRVAADLGLDEIPVAGGGGDAVIQTTGMGIIKEGVTGTIIGTAGIVAMGLSQYRINPTGKVQLFCNNAPGLWHCMGVTLAAGGAYQWYKEIAGRDYYELEFLAKKAKPGSGNLLFAPYLQGERCPYPDPDARGAFVGLNLTHNKCDLVRAVMEGVTFSLRQVADLIASLDENISTKEIITSGGGADSELWRQIQADVFQVPVKTVVGGSEGAAFGAALTGGVACKIWNSLQDSVAQIATSSEMLPNKNNKAVYDDLYAVYKDIYPALREVNRKVSALKL